MCKVKGECLWNKDEGRRSSVSLVIVITSFFYIFSPLYSLEVLHGLSWNANCLSMSSIKGGARTRCDRPLCLKGNYPKPCDTELSSGYKARPVRAPWNVKFCFIFILQLLSLHFAMHWWHKLICLLSLDLSCLHWVVSLAQQQTAPMSGFLILAAQGAQACISGSLALSLPLGDLREILCWLPASESSPLSREEIQCTHSWIAATEIQHIPWGLWFKTGFSYSFNNSTDCQKSLFFQSYI